jgi:hypothetical protein
VHLFGPSLLILYCTSDVNLVLFMFLIFEETCSSKSTSVVCGSATLPDCSKDNLYPFVCWHLQFEQCIYFVKMVAWGSVPETAAVCKGSSTALRVYVSVLTSFWLCAGDYSKSFCCVATCWWCQVIRALGSITCCYKATKCLVLAKFLYFN